MPIASRLTSTTVDPDRIREQRERLRRVTRRASPG